MLKVLFLLLFTGHYINQVKSQDKILFIGHAYGDPNKRDQKLDPSLIKYLSGIEKTKIIYGGDFIQECNDSTEVSNFKKINSKNDLILIPGNHDLNCENFNHKLNRKEVFNENIFFYLNTNFSSKEKIKEAIDFISNSLNDNSFKNILIFSHQFISSKSDWDLKTNSRDFYSFANIFYDQLEQMLLNKSQKVFIYSGDIGAFSFSPYAYFDTKNNLEFISAGLGNGYNNKIVEITLKGNSVENRFIDLDTKQVESKENYKRWKVKFYQFPKIFAKQLIDKIEIILYCFLFLAILIFWRSKNKS